MRLDLERVDRMIESCFQFHLNFILILFVQFADGVDPAPGDRIVYAAGAFDLFHVGLLDFLEKAKEQGEYVIVGLHTDSDVNRYKV